MFASDKVYDDSATETIAGDSHKDLDKIKVPKPPSRGKEIWYKTLDLLQTMGKTLQFPIAVLPFAAILNRFGALGIGYTSTVGLDGTLTITNQAGYWISFIIQTPGVTIFNNIALFFAIGVGFGIAKDHRGEAALATVAFFLVTAALNGENGLAQMIWEHLPHNGTFGYWDHTGKWWCNLYYAKTYTPGSATINGGAYVLNTGVVGGIIAGCFTAFLYNRSKNIILPQALSFFGGRRFVPMLAIACAVPVSFIYAVLWPWIQFGLTQFGGAISGANAGIWSQAGGVFAYGTINRMLQPFGLHQILNTFLWFQLPITGPLLRPLAGTPINGTQNHITGVWTVQTQIINGDINAYTAGMFGAGNFQSGYFPTLMCGEPAAVVAMIWAARKENRASVAGFLGGAAATCFLTGIDEPVTFSFVFISPVLLVVHSLITGVFNAIVILMHIKVGFGFSSGFIDYCVSFPYAWGFAHFQQFTWVAQDGIQHVGNKAFTILGNPLWTLALGAIAFVIYLFVFVVLIRKLNVQTPGREEDYDASSYLNVGGGSGKKSKAEQYKNMAEVVIDVLGKDNIEVIDNCATRLRIAVKDNSMDLQEKRIKAAGMFSIQRHGTKFVHIVVGVDVEHVTDILHDTLHI